MEPIRLPIKKKEVYYLLPDFIPKYTDFTYASRLDVASPYVISDYLHEFYDFKARSYKIEGVFTKFFYTQPRTALLELIINTLEDNGFIIGEPTSLIDFLYQKPLSLQEIREEEEKWWANRKKYITRANLQKGYLLKK